MTGHLYKRALRNMYGTYPSRKLLFETTNLLQEKETNKQTQKPNKQATKEDKPRKQKQTHNLVPRNLPAQLGSYSCIYRIAHNINNNKLQCCYGKQMRFAQRQERKKEETNKQGENKQRRDKEERTNRNRGFMALADGCS